MRLLDRRKFLAIALLMIPVTFAVVGASPKTLPSVRDINVSSNGNSVEVRILTDSLVRYTYFELSSPRRLVVDFHGSQSGLEFREREVATAGVDRIRTSAFTSRDRKATRVVFDLGRDVPYRISDGEGAVTVTFGNEEPATAPANLTASLGTPVIFPVESPESTPTVVPPMLTAMPRIPETVAGPYLGAVIRTLRSPLELEIPGPPAAPPTPAKPAVAMQAAGAQQPVYSGEIISLDLKDVDIKDFFRLIGEISGLNMVLDPNVSGTLTLLLRDVPWDQALDVVLRNYQLGRELQGNVLRIATTATLQAEEDSKKKLRDAQELAAELQTRTFVLNYTKAESLNATIQRMLTQRGSIIMDARRNALIISDIPGQFGKIDSLVKFLDTPSQQVEIEARLLSANKSFSRDLGSQLGFVIGNRSGNAISGVPQAGNSPFQRTPAPSVRGGAGSSIPLVANFPAAANAGLSFLMGVGGDVILDEIITVAESKGTAKLISRPKVTTQNNQAATVSQGVQIPVQTNVNNTITVQFLNFALQLTVTPQITDAGTILLNVQVENSTPDFARAVNGIPSVATQRASTQVLIPDGGTAVIGGILVDNDSVNIRQIPGLGSIPVLGNLFKNTSVLKSTQELLFFITSRIKPTDAINILGSPQDQPAAPPRGH